MASSLASVARLLRRSLVVVALALLVLPDSVHGGKTKKQEKAAAKALVMAHEATIQAALDADALKRGFRANPLKAPSTYVPTKVAIKSVNEKACAEHHDEYMNEFAYSMLSPHASVSC